MKKLKLGIISLAILCGFTLASCNNETPSVDFSTSGTSIPTSATSTTKLPTTTAPVVNPGAAYYDVPADKEAPYDHYFSNKLNLGALNPTISKDSKGKLSGNFIADGIAKMELKSVTDGDTAVFYLNNVAAISAPRVFSCE